MNARPSFAHAPRMDRGSRLARVGAALGPVGVDALLVTKLVNIRWLTGFTGSSAMVLILPDDLVFITDGRYRDQVVTELAAAGVEADITITSTPATVLSRRCGDQSLSRIGMEADAVSWSTMDTARTEWFAGAELVATRGLIEDLRALKDPAEIACIEAAAAIADLALAQVATSFGSGVTEVEIAVGLDSHMRRLGAEAPAFETIVASGPHSGVPHHRPGHRVLSKGDLLVIDMGATVDGYRSDMTRSFVIGEPTPEQARLLDVVGAAQQAGLAAVAGGVATRDVDAASRAVIDAAGWGDAFVHPTGHGVGLEIHEALRLAATSTATLAAGHVVTVEPGVYLPGFGGVRIEDTVEVTASGCRPLTRSSLPQLVG